MLVADYLRQNKVVFEFCSHRPAFTAQHLAAEEHTPGMDVAKSVLVQADGKYYLCVLPACCKVDVDKLRQQMAVNEVRLATEKEMAQLFTDSELGAEPPFGSIYNITTILDQCLGKDGYLICQAGTHEKAVRIALSDYIMLVKPRILDFCYHLH